MQKYNRNIMLNIMHFGAYWQKENDIIFAMVKDLERVTSLMVVDTHLYDDKKNNYVTDDSSLNKFYPIRYINDNIVKNAVLKFSPNIIIVNSGGMSFRKNIFDFLNKKKIKTIGISLSDPDVFPYNGKIYAHEFDLFCTNSKFSYLNQYKNVNIEHLPFAASPLIHYPLENNKKEHDIIIVGGYRQDRLNVAKTLSEKFNVGIYGSGWPKIGSKNYGQINGKGHLSALNSGKIYISFSKTVAGYHNVKVGLFEAAACKNLLVTEDFSEVYNYFEKDKEIITYTNKNELVEKIEYFLHNKNILDDITNASYNRFIREHTWEKRWTKILSKII